jgi:propanol-preferring alcohol dehydrogenase
MPEMMRAAVVRAFGAPLEIDELPIPVPGPGEVLVKIAATGVCHTDLHAADGDWSSKPSLPFVPGHEGAGNVVAVGPGVKRVKEGDAVGIAWLHSTCGECEYCITGWESLCPAQRNSGYGVNGTFAEYAVGAAPYVAKLPAGVDFPSIAPILCAGVTTYKALRETEARSGQWVAISGVGGLGHIAIQYAKAMGLHVAALDVTDAKLQLARSVGADLTVNATDPDAARQIVKHTQGGAHGVVVTAVSPSAFSQAIGMARRKGTVVFVGLPPGTCAAPIFDVVLKRITLRGSIVGTRNDLDEALAFAGEGRVRAHLHTVPLDDINRVFADLRAGTIDGRAVVDLTPTRTLSGSAT